MAQQVLWICGLSRSHGVDCVFTDMREASRRLSQSLFDAYDPGWVGEEDLAVIVEVRKISCPIQITAAADLQKDSGAASILYK